jgi:hypothetical protein
LTVFFSVKFGKHLKAGRRADIFPLKTKKLTQQFFDKASAFISPNPAPPSENGKRAGRDSE